MPLESTVLSGTLVRPNLSKISYFYDYMNYMYLFFRPTQSNCILVHYIIICCVFACYSVCIRRITMCVRTSFNISINRDFNTFSVGRL